jgi:hypothetical protein
VADVHALGGEACRVGGRCARSDYRAAVRSFQLLNILLVSAGIVAGCGSSSSAAKTQQARTYINDACTQYAETMLTTDPNSGLQQLSVQDAGAALTHAAQTARSAAELDAQWNEAARALLALAAALRDQSNAEMRKAVPSARAACNPVIASIPTTTGS